MATVVGDTLQCAAFMAYAGYFDQQQRAALLRRWQDHLHEVFVCQARLVTLSMLEQP